MSIILPQTTIKLDNLATLAHRQYRDRGWCDSVRALAKACGVSGEALSKHRQDLVDWIKERNYTEYTISLVKAEAERQIQRGWCDSWHHICKACGSNSVTAARRLPELHAAILDLSGHKSYLFLANKLLDDIDRRGDSFNWWGELDASPISRAWFSALPDDHPIKQRLAMLRYQLCGKVSTAFDDAVDDLTPIDDGVIIHRCRGRCQGIIPHRVGRPVACPRCGWDGLLSDRLTA